MIELDQYKNKIVGVVGLARSGISAIRSLVAAGAKVIAWDDNEAKLIEAKEDLKTQQQDQLVFASPAEEVWQSVVAIMMSPGIPLYYPKEYPLYSLSQHLNIPMYCDVEFLYQAQSNASFIGITGTNGKSTTTALIHHVLKSEKITTEIGGNIGIPALQMNPLSHKDEFYVLEISSYQLDLIAKTRFNIAVCLTITPDHIDRHGTFARYVEAKYKIFENHGESDIAIVSNNCFTNATIIKQLTAKGVYVIPLSTEKVLPDGISIVSNILYDNHYSKQQYDVSGIPGLIGEHNCENMSAAFAACVAVGISPHNVVAHFKTFKALPHRMDLFHQYHELNFINDSKATNADSTYWALKSLKSIYWIAGGISKDAGICLLKPLLEKVIHAYLIGDAAESFAKTLAEENIPFTIAGTLENAVELIRSQNIKKGNVLLSPACASFDQWRNYEERGNAFISLVQQNW